MPLEQRQDGFALLCGYVNSSVYSHVSPVMVRYSTSADRPTISTMRTSSSIPLLSVNRNSSPRMKWTGCCSPWLMAMLEA